MGSRVMQPFVKRRAIVNIAERGERMMRQLKGEAVSGKPVLYSFGLPLYLQKCGSVPPVMRHSDCVNAAVRRWAGDHSMAAQLFIYMAQYARRDTWCIGANRYYPGKAKVKNTFDRIREAFAEI